MRFANPVRCLKWSSKRVLLKDPEKMQLTLRPLPGLARHHLHTIPCGGPETTASHPCLTAPWLASKSSTWPTHCRPHDSPQPRQLHLCRPQPQLGQVECSLNITSNKNKGELKLRQLILNPDVVIDGYQLGALEKLGWIRQLMWCVWGRVRKRVCFGCLLLSGAAPILI